jgi:hypothetical protein
MLWQIDLYAGCQPATHLCLPLGAGAGPNCAQIHSADFLCRWNRGSCAMTKTMLFSAVLATAVMLAGPVTEARGPSGGGRTGAPSGGGTSAPSGGSTSKADYPPGFSSEGQKQGWDGGTTPPGWDDGLRKGWDGGLVPPGFDKGESKGWDTSVTPAPQPAPKKE